MNRALRRWVLPIVRYGLCAAAILYLVYNVPWHDHVRLADAERTRVRLLETRTDTLLIERDGRPVALPYDAFYRETFDGELRPVVEYGIPSVVLGLDGRLALFAILLFCPVWFIQSHRLVVMVAIQGVKLTYWNAVKLTFAGNFFNFALPGTTGGDLVKAYYLTRYTHLKTEVFTTVFLDRAIGLFSIVLIAGFAILLRWDPEEFGELVGGLVVVLVVLLIGGIIVFSKRLRHLLRLPELAAMLPMGHQVIRIGRATVAMREHKLRVVLALVESIVLQSIVMVSAAVMAKALGMGGAVSYYFIYVSIGFLIAAVPIAPPQAIGVMEAAYVQFFTHSGLATASQAVALALAVRLIQLVWALPGVLVPIFGAHLPRKSELEALEAVAQHEPDPATET